jgi:protein phosphatase
MTTAAVAAQPVDAFGLTDVGRVRAGNEDHFLIAAMQKSVEIRHTSLAAAALGRRFHTAQAHLFAVADGVGGRPGGELASEATVEALLRAVAHAAGCYHSMDVEQELELLTRLERATHDAHRRIIDEFGDGERAPATTLTLAMLVWPRAYLIHVGDSRAYYLRRGRLQQITRDQTIGEFMVNIGAWTEDQAVRAAAARSLASAIGGAELAPSVGLIDLEPGDVLLLCTDGLTKHVSDAEIAGVLGGPADAATMCRELVDRALAGGGSDNVTVVVARMARPAA